MVSLCRRKANVPCMVRFESAIPLGPETGDPLSKSMALPPAPFPECGTDPTLNPLRCEGYPPCLEIPAIPAYCMNGLPE